LTRILFFVKLNLWHKLFIRTIFLKLIMSITYQPKKKKRKKTHGFRKRKKTKSGRRTILRRKKKGRWEL